METEKLRKQLISKAMKEQKSYIDSLKKLSPEEILDRAYEKVMRDDILVALEYTALSGKQLSALLKTEYPVSVCFDEWQRKDETYMDRLMDVVNEYSNKLVKDEEKNKRRYDIER